MRQPLRIAALILIGLTCQWLCPAAGLAEQQTLEKRHERFYRSGDGLDLGKLLGFGEIEAGTIGEISIRYNMPLSKLEVEWLFDGEVIGGRALSRGLGKTVRQTYDRALPGQVAVRFKGTKGQLQMLAVEASLEIADKAAHGAPAPPAPGVVAIEPPTILPTEPPTFEPPTFEPPVFDPPRIGTSVPRLLRMSREEAQAELERLGLGYEMLLATERRENSAGLEGRVIDQSPEPDAFVALASRVSFTVYRPAKLQLQASLDPQLFAPTSYLVTKQGTDPLPPSVDLRWALTDAEGAELYSETITLAAEAFEERQQQGSSWMEARGEFWVPPVSRVLQRVTCAFVHHLDPDNEWVEWSESDNRGKAKFGECGQPPTVPDPSRLVDLVPEFSSNTVSEPDAEGYRTLTFTILNRGPGQVRSPFTYQVVSPHRGGWQFGSHDVFTPLRPGERLSFSERLREDLYEKAAGVMVSVDLHYRLAESDKLNNVGVFPSDMDTFVDDKPEEIPDLTAEAWYDVELSNVNCPKPGWTLEGCRALVYGNVNLEQGRWPPSGVDLEMSILDATGKEFYIDRSFDGKNQVIFVVPLEIFQRACKVRLMADPDEVIAETNEANNVFFQELAHCGQDPPLADLAVESLTIESNPSLGSRVVAKAVCRNIGNARFSANRFAYKWTVNGTTSSGAEWETRLPPFGAETLELYQHIDLSELPEGLSSFDVRLDLNDGSVSPRQDEIRFENNGMEAAFELPDGGS